MAHTHHAAPAVPRAISAYAPVTFARGGTITGYASLFGATDLGRDVVLPGAFAASLARRGARGIRMLWQHDPAEPIGTWHAIAEDLRGLHVEGRLAVASSRARDVAALVEAGAVDGLSIGFRTVRARRDPARNVRLIAEIDLWEISVVTFPLMPGARIDRAAAPGPQPPIRDSPAAALRALARGLRAA